MVRAAAKNHASVAVVTSPYSYPLVVDALRNGGTTAAQRRALAARAFVDIAEYDVAVADWFAVHEALDADTWWPEFGGVAARLDRTLRYGENPHQRAPLYTDPTRPARLGQANPIHCQEK